MTCVLWMLLHILDWKFWPQHHLFNSNYLNLKIKYYQTYHHSSSSSQEQIRKSCWHQTTSKTNICPPDDDKWERCQPGRRRGGDRCHCNCSFASPASAARRFSRVRRTPDFPRSLRAATPAPPASRVSRVPLSRVTRAPRAGCSAPRQPCGGSRRDSRAADPRDCGQPHGGRGNCGRCRIEARLINRYRYVQTEVRGVAITVRQPRGGRAAAHGKAAARRLGETDGRLSETSAR
jgi:hypothetical protein